MNYIQKNRKNIIIGVVALSLLAAIIALWLQQRSVNTSEDIVATVSPSTLKVGDSLYFEDKSFFTENIKWDFGDGNNSDKAKGLHIFRKAGYYPVTVLINNKVPKTFYVLVSNSTKREDSVVIPTAVEGPTQAMQFANVIFRANSINGKQFTWKFGETGNIDSKDKTAIYSYKTPGNYIVSLTTDETSEPVLHRIKILPAYDEIAEDNAPSADQVYNKINDDFKYHLQQIANGENFNTHYNYLVKTYLCDNKDNTSVLINETKKDGFYYYCTGLQFDKGNHIDEVKTTFDNDQNCVINVQVKQSK